MLDEILEYKEYTELPGSDEWSHCRLSVIKSESKPVRAFRVIARHELEQEGYYEIGKEGYHNEEDRKKMEEIRSKVRETLQGVREEWVKYKIPGIAGKDTWDTSIYGRLDGKKAGLNAECYDSIIRSAIVLGPLKKRRLKCRARFLTNLLKKNMFTYLTESGQTGFVNIGDLKKAKLKISDGGKKNLDRMLKIIIAYRTSPCDEDGFCYINKTDLAAWMRYTSYSSSSHAFGVYYKGNNIEEKPARSVPGASRIRIYKRLLDEYGMDLEEVNEAGVFPDREEGYIYITEEINEAMSKDKAPYTVLCITDHNGNKVLDKELSLKDEYPLVCKDGFVLEDNLCTKDGGEYNDTASAKLWIQAYLMQKLYISDYNESLDDWIEINESHVNDGIPYTKLYPSRNAYVSESDLKKFRNALEKNKKGTEWREIYFRRESVIYPLFVFEKYGKTSLVQLNPIFTSDDYSAIRIDDLM